MQIKKLTAIILSLVLVSTVFVFSGCTSNNNTLTVATNATFPPYEYISNNEVVGIDIDIAQAIADKLGMKLEVADVDFGAIISGVQTGKYSMGMAGMTVTDERKQNVDFSNSYATGIQSIIVKKDSEYNSLDDFYEKDENGAYKEVKQGVKIGVQQDTTGDIYASESVEDSGFGDDNVIRYKSGADAIQALETGKVSAVIIDNEPAKSFVAANDSLRILDAPYTDEEYAICVSKNNDEFLNQINDVLKELIDDGTVKSIIDSYINK